MMRRAYGEVLRRLSGRARLRPRLLLHFLSARIRPGLVPPPAPPLFATLEITGRCNLRCTYCESAGGGSGPPAAFWHSVLDELLDAGVPALGFTGGEPLLHEATPALASRAAGRGCWVHLNTNGTLLDEGTARALVEGGLSSVNVSLDAAEAPLHDRVRGPGAFAAALEGIRRLVRARDAAGSRKPRILLAVTLGEHNAGQALPLLSLAEELGVEGCTFLPAARFKEGPRPRPAPSAARDAARLRRRARRDPRVDNSPAYLRGMERFLLGAAAPSTCSAPHTSLLVSREGRLYPCVPAALRRREGVPARPGGLIAAFRSGAPRRALDEETCRRCWWNCHRELDLALGILP